MKHDAIIVGGGHNGLVAAGLIAKAGANVVVLERRATVGGAAVTEQPWGPGFKMSALSYVMSRCSASWPVKQPFARCTSRASPTSNGLNASAIS